MNVTDPNQYKLGITGLAFLRNWLTGDPTKNDVLLDEVSQILSDVSKADGQAKPIQKYNIKDGYQKWADNYDDMPNLLIDAEEPVVKKILESLPKGKAIDVACGTGRYAAMLEAMGHDITGVDQSEEMLKIAKLKHPEISFKRLDIQEKLSSAWDDKSYDLAVSALALTHFISLQDPIRSIASIVNRNGIIVLSDIHPMIVSLGGHADFLEKSGEHGFITNHVHWHGEYLKAFRENNLEVISCHEPKLKSIHTKVLQEAFSMDEITMQTALNGLPIALIWELRKR